MIPYRIRKPLVVSAILLVAVLLAGTSFGKHKTTPDAPPFQYAAGTENIEKGCEGKLEVHKEGITYICPGGTFSMAFSGITVMQFRPDVSDKVMAMKIPWKIAPMLPKIKENKYFTIVSNERGKLRAVVLRVSENDMRPYFAEIELQSGKGVQEYRNFDEFQ
jgi:hypothetical protein